jgi:hypothetical protein
MSLADNTTSVRQHRRHMIHVDLITVIIDGHQTSKDDQAGLIHTRWRDIKCLINSEMDITITCPEAVIKSGGDIEID